MRSVSINLNSKKVFLGVTDGSDEKSFDELFDLSGLDVETIKAMSEDGVIHFSEKERKVSGGNIG